jgi:hypothetical protein
MTPFARLLAIAATTIGAAALLLMFGGNSQQAQVIMFPVTPPPAPTPAATPAPDEPAGGAETPKPDAVDTNAPAPAPLALSTDSPAWERQLEAVAGPPPKSAAEISRAIFALLPALPEEALAAAAERAVDALPNGDYTAVALPVVTNPRTHNRAMSVLFSDLMERPDAIALPALLQIARNPEHAFAPSAKDNLQLLLKADFGSDWARWGIAIQQALATAQR